MRYDPDSKKTHTFAQDKHEEGHWQQVAILLKDQQRVVHLMQDYTGDLSMTFKLHQDPQHPWMWAVRDSNEEDHLVNLRTEEIEWVEFTKQWPPRSMRS